jgi:hypothetical protein
MMMMVIPHVVMAMAANNFHVTRTQVHHEDK